MFVYVCVCVRVCVCVFVALQTVGGKLIHGKHAARNPFLIAMLTVPQLQSAIHAASGGEEPHWAPMQTSAPWVPFPRSGDGREAVGAIDKIVHWL